MRVLAHMPAVIALSSATSPATLIAALLFYVCASAGLPVTRGKFKIRPWGLFFGMGAV